VGIDLERKVFGKKLKNLIPY